MYFGSKKSLKKREGYDLPSNIRELVESVLKLTGYRSLSSFHQEAVRIYLSFLKGEYYQYIHEEGKVFTFMLDSELIDQVEDYITLCREEKVSVRGLDHRSKSEFYLSAVLFLILVKTG